jgi:hypothetical protein
MSTIERVALAIVGVAMATTLLLPGRQTPQVLDAAGRLFSGGIRAAMGR